jgi:hypothetical protein
VCNERKGKCFPVLFKRKTLSFVKVMFSVLTRIQFPLTIFLYCCQTWENKESEFQEFTFLQSNTALMSLQVTGATNDTTETPETVMTESLVHASFGSKELIHWIVKWGYS